MVEHIDIEGELRVFVRSIGGEVVEDLFPPQTRNFENADFVFRHEGVVAELKILTKDQSTAPDILQKTTAIYQRAVKQGLAPPIHGSGVKKLQASDLPVSVHREIADAHKQPVQSHVRDASKQIKATKERLGMPDAKGLLLLFNDGNFRLQLDMIKYLLGRVLGPNFRSINSIIYGTANIWSEATFTDKLITPIVSFKREGVEPVDSVFLHNFMHGWQGHLAKLNGGPAEVIHLPASPDSLSALRLTKSKPGWQ